jgi:hypothetical protein
VIGIGSPASINALLDDLHGLPRFTVSHGASVIGHFLKARISSKAGGGERHGDFSRNNGGNGAIQKIRRG